TYFGGTALEESFLSGIAVDAQFNAYLAGHTFSSENQLFPIKGNAYLKTCPADCMKAAFVAKIDPSQAGTNSLIYSTYLVLANNMSQGASVAVDGANPAHAYVTNGYGVVAINGDGSLLYSNLNVGTGGDAIAV